ncbi:hypothetical protein NJB95_04150 [Brucella intermedia]|uniref:HEPN domain-containing protein n=3 Tax=Brucella/Ochrobactrum group TaxID=2826938 RepID=UPI0012FDEC7D|nr:hypothetical protein [Brucella intermedia]MCO7735796.1 hypothetical protein [Brucella intermedia]WLF98304.1 hypothetical protein Q5698_20360 [Brucella intermedia]
MSGAPRIPMAVLGRLTIDQEAGGGEDQPPLRVCPSMPVRYDPPEGRFDPGPADVLLDGMGRPAEFAEVLTHWFATEADMATPRGRFWDSFKKQNFYDADRIIAAANLFDTIPASHYPKKISLPADILDAAEKAKALFKPLPDSHERESMLRELSNLVTPRLRSKVKHWAAELIKQHGDQYEGLEFVIDRAVKCRNFYVHGGKAEFDYGQEFNLFVFLIRTLEFCYIVPEFLRAGWSHADWLRQSGNFHPFDEYRSNYNANLTKLREVLASEQA